MTRKNNENRYTIRLDNHTALKLDELTKSLNISYNLEYNNLMSICDSCHGEIHKHDKKIITD